MLFCWNGSVHLFCNIIQRVHFPCTNRFDEYGDTFTYEERCFRTDFTKPDHCANSETPCNEDILQFGHRIIRNKLLNVTFDGWFDPEPDSVVTGASGGSFSFY